MFQISLTQPLQCFLDCLFVLSICLVRETARTRRSASSASNLPFSWTDGPESRTPRSSDAEQEADGRLTQAIGLHVPKVEHYHRRLFKRPLPIAMLTPLAKSWWLGWALLLGNGPAPPLSHPPFPHWLDSALLSSAVPGAGTPVS